MPTDEVRIAGRFELGSLIGGGTAGSVYRALDTVTGETVAVKVLQPEVLADSAELLERFQREGEALRRLNHPNIVKVLMSVEEAGRYYLVMEYVAGGSLADLLRREHKLPVERVVSIGLELSDALSRAHHLHILHRDIKPANILLSEDGSPRLSDFGLARLGGLSGLTNAGSLLGTPYYLSPEACYGQEVDERTDLWAFGVVMFEMLSGQRPFRGETPFEVIYAIKNQGLPDLARYREDLPPALVGLVRKMLKKDRAARISSARQVGAELEQIQHAPAVQVVADAVESKAAEPPEKIRVLIVDDHAVVRQGLRTFIDLQDDLTVVGEGSDGAEGVALAAELQPDVVLLDLVMPRLDGVEATRLILQRSPHSHVIILTSFGEDNQVFPAIRNGAQGYLLKDIHPNDLVKAVREANQGKVQLHPDIAKKLMSAVATAPAEGSEPATAAMDARILLTERELEVVRLIAQGLTNRDIAGQMVISEKTVKTHVSNILSKLGLEDRTQAAIWALKNGLA